MKTLNEKLKTVAEFMGYEIDKAINNEDVENFSLPLIVRIKNDKYTFDVSYIPQYHSDWNELIKVWEQLYSSVSILVENDFYEALKKNNIADAFEIAVESINFLTSKS